MPTELTPAMLRCAPALRPAHANNHHANHPGPVAPLEPNPRHAPLAESQVQKRAAGKIHVRIVSHRKKLGDADGLCIKYVLDCCRYAGWIKDDTTEDITLETSQQKTAKGEEERTILEIIYP